MEERAKREVSGKVSVEGKVDVDLTKEVVSQMKSERSESASREGKKLRLDQVTLVVGVLYAALTAVLAFESWQSTNIARSSLESVQRAFITFKTLHAVEETEHTARGDLKAVLLSSEWENSGTTPAIQFRQVFNSGKHSGPITEEEFLSASLLFDYPTTYLGPKGTTISGSFGYPLEKISLNLQPGAKERRVSDLNILAWGWTVYRDVFKGTKEHVTEFCVQLNSVRLSDDPAKLPDMSFGTCVNHNCTDEYCPDYKEVISVAAKN